MRLAKNSIYLLCDKVFILFSGLVLSIYTYRELGPEQVGILNSAQSYWALFGFLLSLGLESVLVQLSVNNKNNKLLPTAFVMKLIGSLLGAGLSLVIAVWFQDRVDFLIALLFYALGGVFSSFNVVDCFFQAQGRSDVGVKCRVFAKLVSYALHIYFLATGKTLIYFAFVTFFYNVVLSVSYGWFYKYSYGLKLISFNRSSVSISLAKKLFVKSYPLMLASIAVPIFMQSDVVMINSMLGGEEAGYYSAATKLIIPLNLFSTALVTAFFPYLVSLYGRNENVYYDACVSFLHGMLIYLSLCVSLFVYFFSDTIVAWLYGVEFSRSSDILKIQAWTCCLSFIGPAGTRWLIIKGLQKFEFYKTALAAIVNVILNAVLISSNGAVGAAYSSLISYAVANILFFLFFKDTREYFFVLLSSFKPSILLSSMRKLRNPEFKK
ncbi:MAG: flippase [Gammaproteobacteria bacterium]|nr:flippase [Gammaproteobacteria bacterium]